MKFRGRHADDVAWRSIWSISRSPLLPSIPLIYHWSNSSAWQVYPPILGTVALVARVGAPHGTTETWSPLGKKEVLKPLNTMAGQAKVMGGGRHNGWSYRLVCIYILAWVWELIATKNPEERGQRGMEIDLKRTASRSTRTNNAGSQTNLQSTSYGITADLDFFLLDLSVYIAFGLTWGNFRAGKRPEMMSDCRGGLFIAT